jgi:hypothetical protein
LITRMLAQMTSTHATRQERNHNTISQPSDINDFLRAQLSSE